MATVYEYKGVSYELPDGLSNEAAVAKIKASLGESACSTCFSTFCSTYCWNTKELSVVDQIKRQLGLAARGVVTGVSAPANIVTDFFKWCSQCWSKHHWTHRKRVPYLSKEQSKGLTQLGVPQPETGAERAAQVGMQALTSAGGMAAAAPKSILVLIWFVNFLLQLLLLWLHSL